jgi:hypothetical protein
VVPVPVLPACSQPVLFSVIRLLASVMPAVGVKVAVQVMPPSLDCQMAQNAMLDAEVGWSKPVTASLKVMVTVVLADCQRCVRHHDGRRRALGVDGVVVGVGGAVPALPAAST